MKKNKKKLFTNIVIASALSFAVAGCGFAFLYQNVNYNVSLAFDDDDDLYTITLSSQELAETTFTYLADYFYSYVDANSQVSALNTLLAGTYLNLYNSDVGFSDTFTDSTKVQYRNPTYFINFNISGNDKGKWAFNTISSGPFNMTNPLTLKLTADNYSDINIAIQKDLGIYVEPEPAGMGGAMQDFISLLTGGIVSLANGIATGVADFASALFLTVEDGAVTGLSIFGGIVAIFAGLALAVGITTKVYTWITSLGN